MESLDKARRTMSQALRTDELNAEARAFLAPDGCHPLPSQDGQPTQLPRQSQRLVSGSPDGLQRWTPAMDSSDGLQLDSGCALRYLRPETPLFRHWRQRKWLSPDASNGINCGITRLV